MIHDLTLEQMIHWGETCNEIEYEYSVHSYYNFKFRGLGGRPDRYSPMKWVNGDNIVGSHSFGGMVGYENAEIGWGGGRKDPEQTKRMAAMQKENNLKMYPQLEKIYDMGTIGSVGMHSVANSVFEVAEDGMSCRASFYTPGIMAGNAGRTGKLDGSIMWERYGTDWLFEEGEWRTVHNMVAEDFTEDMDHVNYAEEAWHALEETGICAARLMHVRPNGIEIRGPAHMNYSAVQVPQYNLLPPEPYDTLNHTEWYVARPGDGSLYSTVFEVEDFDALDALTRWFGPPMGGPIIEELRSKSEKHKNDPPIPGPGMMPPPPPKED